MSSKKLIMLRLSTLAGLSFIFTMAVIQDSSACSSGFMKVSDGNSAFSCQRTNKIMATPVPVLSNEDCPDGSQGATGSLDACRKTLNGRSEIVLRTGEACPHGTIRFVDSDGYEACRIRSSLTSSASDTDGSGS